MEKNLILHENFQAFVCGKCGLRHAKPHTSFETQQILLQLGWDLLPHPLYLLDLAPSDYHLFHCLQNSLRGKNFYPDGIWISFFFKKRQAILWTRNDEAAWKMAKGPKLNNMIYILLNIVFPFHKTKLLFIYIEKPKRT